MNAIKVSSIQTKYRRILNGIVKSRNMTLVANVKECEKEYSVVIFGSFKLIHKKGLTGYKSYSLFRMKQVSLTETKWVAMHGRNRNAVLSLLRPYFIAGSSNYLVRELYDLAFKLLYRDLRSFVPVEVRAYLRRRCMAFNGGRITDGWRNGDKLLSAFLRKITDKSILSTLLKVYQWKFIYATMNDYIFFLRKFKITGDCGSLYPLLKRFVKDGAECDGTNQWFVDNVKLFTRGEIKLLRKSPPSLVGAVTDSNCKLLVFILRNSNRKRFPVPVLAEILEHFDREWYEPGDSSEQCRFQLIDKWLTHYSGVWRKHGYKKYLAEWSRLITEICHAIDWAMATGSHVHKNQVWESITKQVEQWDNSRKKNLQSFAKWEPATTKPVSIDQVVFSELTTSDALYDEGEVMHHCVYSYSSYCMSNKYRVFQVKSDIERATLGVSVENGIYKFHQLYSYCNEVVSPVLHSSAEKLISQLNAG